jgi:thiamine biosynthesis protein ThiI
MDGILIHFHEITLKGDNRYIFTRYLLDNLRFALKKEGGFRHEPFGGGFFLFFDDNVDFGVIKEKLSKVFGVSNFYPFFEGGRDKESLEKSIGGKLAGIKSGSFKIDTHRSDKSIPFSSHDINCGLGDFVREKTGMKVDLENPGTTIYIFGINGRFVCSFEKHEGARGLPVGASGRVVSLISGGFDSPIAAFMAMRRGCGIIFAHFHGYPYLNHASIDKVREIVAVLDKYQYNSKLYLIPFGEIQKEISVSCPAGLRVVLYRRFMARIASRIALNERAGALITGDSIGQVASQTLENMFCAEDAAGVLMLRPLVGMDKEEIIRKSKEIGMHDISVLPDDDCCKLFIPDNPETKAGLNAVRRAEEKLDISNMVDSALKKAVIENF